MLLAFLAFLGGVLTILSPCVLPVLPFAFARSDQPFTKSTLPLLLGMALTFAAIATLAAVGGGWAVQLNSLGRTIALIVLALFGVALLSQARSRLPFRAPSSPSAIASCRPRATATPRSWCSPRCSASRWDSSGRLARGRSWA